MAKMGVVSVNMQGHFSKIRRGKSPYKIYLRFIRLLELVTKHLIYYLCHVLIPVTTFMAKTNGDTPKSYSKFTDHDIEKTGLRIKKKKIFPTLRPVTPGLVLQSVISMMDKLHLGSEKAKSEHLIAPVLFDIFEKNQQKIAYFSGYNFEVAPEKGLTGFCDYLLTRDPESVSIEAPVFCIVEAKNENLDIGEPQCFAEMYAAQIFNEQKQRPQKAIYGCVTDGERWRFYKLEASLIIREPETFFIVNIPRLLGAFQYIIDEF
jgi:hypothetical protein